MFEVNAGNAAEYLGQAGRIHANEPVEAREFSGGVSNVVVLISLPMRGERFVLKQARGRLRVKEDWHCPVERIWREIETLRTCGELLTANAQEPADEFSGTVPQVLFEDRENFLYAMTSAPPEHQTWREMLLAGPGSMHVSLSRACGRMLAAIHAGSWRKAELAARFEDRAYFDQLRLDPYYRQIARAHPDRAEAIQQLIWSVQENRLALVHGDFSPKNLLVWPGQMMLIDYEVGHFGDPAFDLGFFLTHLVLKGIWSGSLRSYYASLIGSFWTTYSERMAQMISSAEFSALEQRAVDNLAGCMLARIDGKSPVDYLTADNQRTVRETARRWLAAPGDSIHEAIDVVSGT